MKTSLKSIIQEEVRKQLNEKSSKVKAKLNKVFRTPKGDEYSLIGFEKRGNTWIYTYKWLNAPKEVTDNTNAGIQAKRELGLRDIMQWISDLKDAFGVK